MTQSPDTSDGDKTERTAATQPQAVDAETQAQTGENPRRGRRRLIPLIRYLATLTAVAVAGVFVLWMWNVYMVAPWTRDGTVRAYVVTMAPEVSGRIVELPVRDNQLVKKGELLMVIEPTNYKIAVQSAEADVERAKAVSLNAQADADRRKRLMRAAVSQEEKETYEARALTAEANLRQAVANLEQARVNLKRTRIVSPVNGFVTNLLAQLGDYANVGENLVSLVNADSFWVDGYFEETNIGGIRVGDPATVKLMGYDAVIEGHVDSIARGINVPNAQPNGEGLANVNPIFTWVRLAQRIPVRIHIDRVPEGIVLSAGMTATVEVHPKSDAPPARTTEAYNR